MSPKFTYAWVSSTIFSLYIFLLGFPRRQDFGAKKRGSSPAGNTETGVYWHKAYLGSISRNLFPEMAMAHISGYFRIRKGISFRHF